MATLLLHEEWRIPATDTVTSLSVLPRSPSQPLEIVHCTRGGAAVHSLLTLPDDASPSSSSSSTLHASPSTFQLQRSLEIHHVTFPLASISSLSSVGSELVEDVEGEGEDEDAQARERDAMDVDSGASQPKQQLNSSSLTLSPSLSASSPNVSPSRLEVVAFGGLGRKVVVAARDLDTVPIYRPLLTINVKHSVNTVLLKTTKLYRGGWQVALYVGGFGGKITEYALVVKLSNRRVVIELLSTSIFTSDDLGHTAHIRSLSCSGDYLVSTSNDGTVRIWSPMSRTCLSKLTEHSQDVLCCSTFNQTIVSGGKDRTIVVSQEVEDAQTRKKREKGLRGRRLKFARTESLATTSVVTCILVPTPEFICVGTAHGVVLMWRKVGTEWTQVCSQKVDSSPITSMAQIKVNEGDYVITSSGSTIIGWRINPAS